MLRGLKKALMYALVLALFLTLYQMYGQPLWNGWLQSQGQTVGFLETAGGYIIAILGGLFVRFIVWRKMGKES